MLQQVTYRAKRIPILPEVVDYQAIRNEIGADLNLAVGVNTNTLAIEKYNFKKSAIHFICGYELEEMYPFVTAFASEAYDIPNTDFLFLNSTDMSFANANFKDRLYVRQFDTVLSTISTYVDKVYALYEAADYSDEVVQKQKSMVCFAFGMYDIFNKLKDETKKLLTSMMKKNAAMNLVSFVFVDSPDLLRSFAYEEWFKSGSDTSRGIWVGSGISDQSFIKVAKFNREDREDIPSDYGYVISTSRATRIKLLTDYHKN